MSKKKTDFKCDVSSKKNGDRFAQLHHAQKTALDDTANALQRIIRQQRLTEEMKAPFAGNVTDAKKDVLDAMVNLAIASSGSELSTARSLLSDYGLEDII